MPVSIPSKLISLILLVLLALLPVMLPAPTLFKLVLLGFYAWGLVLARRGASLDWATQPLLPANDRALPYGHAWFWIGGVLLVSILWYLELRQNFYFTQDDNHSQFLPILLNGVQGFFSEGIFPTWDGYVNFGHMTSSVGVYSFTYPPLYLSYAIAHYLLHNDIYLIEVYAWLHLIAGYGLTYGLLRRMGCRPSLASTSAFCFMLTGFNLIAGRSWYMVLPYTLSVPLLAYSIWIFQRSATLSTRWLLLTGGTLGVAFHAGHAQLWAYASMLWGVGMVWVIACKPSRREYFLVSAMAAGVLGLAIAAPLLTMQSMEIMGIHNVMADQGIAAALNNFLLPFPLINSPPPNNWALHADTIGALYYFGTVFFALFMAQWACAIAYFLHGRLGVALLSALTFPVITSLALWFALGDEGGLWSWIAHIPPFNDMNSPFKLLPFIAGFCIIGSAIFLERLWIYRKPGIVKECMILSVAMGLTLLNAMAGKWPWMHFSDVPYPPLPASVGFLKHRDFTPDSWRVLPIAPWRSQALGYVNILPHNYPAFYHIISVDGYNRAIEAQQVNQDIDNLRSRNFELFLQEFGVKAAVVAHDFRPTVPDNRNARTDPRNLKEVVKLGALPHRTIALGNASVLVLDNPDTKPIAYLTAGNDIVALPFRLRPDGMDIRLDGHQSGSTGVTANFLYRPWFAAYGEDGVKLPVTPDRLQRMVIANAPNSPVIQLRYQPPWNVGVAVGVMLALVSLCLWKYALLAGRQRDA